jgi:hypothetical protein
VTGQGIARVASRASWDPYLLNAAALAIVWFVTVALAEPYVAGSLGTGHDAHDYWLAARAADPYAAGLSWGHPGAYVYSPAFLQLASPLLYLPWQVFLAAWTAIALGALVWLSRPAALLPMLFVALPEIWGGNIHLLLAAAIVLGFRYPAVWAFVVLTKVTPGIGLLWFAIRREWRQLAQAAIATGLVVLVSLVLAPDLWRGWIGVLAGNANSDPIVLGVIPIPLVVRLPIALALIVWAAPRNHRWALPVACMLALPAWWVGGLTMLLAIPALIDWKLPSGTPARLQAVARLAGFEPAA